MALTSNRTITSRKQWLFGLLAACLLVFQTSNILHSLNVATHDLDSDCGICDLFTASNDDIDATPATSTRIAFSRAIVESASFESAIGSSRFNARRIRAPPYLS